MESFQKNVLEYKTQLEKGVIQKAYRGLMEYIMELRNYLKNKYPDYYVSGSIYYGYLDMTYFSFSPEVLKQRNLKIALVFLHERLRFEVWLAGANKEVQQKYWRAFRENGWNKYNLVPSTKGADSIVEHILSDNPDFGDLDSLTKRIESETLIFIKEIESFLSKQSFTL